jgi:hypothetical protein
MSALFLVGTHPDSSIVSSAGLLDSDCCQGLTGGLEHEARCADGDKPEEDLASPCL